MSRGLGARSLTRRYGATLALDDLSLDIEPGCFLTLFGPNGAGKTSLLRVLAGALRPDRGELLWDGEPLDPRDETWRARLGVLSHRSFLYDQLTVRENLKFYGALYSLNDVARRIDESLERFGLGKWQHHPAKALSRGLTQRLSLARALLHDPQVVLLDEPYTGLDAHAAARLGEILTHLKDGKRLVVMVTHDLVQGARLADRIAIQVAGKLRLVTDDFPADPTGLEGLYQRTVGLAA
ncbi:MAG: heme ABC exporter ATP-binding protein CcmA [Gemmatimonadota bacterium]